MKLSPSTHKNLQKRRQGLIRGLIVICIFALISCWHENVERGKKHDVYRAAYAYCFTTRKSVDIYKRLDPMSYGEHVFWTGRFHGEDAPEGWTYVETIRYDQAVKYNEEN